MSGIHCLIFNAHIFPTSWKPTPSIIGAKNYAGFAQFGVTKQGRRPLSGTTKSPINAQGDFLARSCFARRFRERKKPKMREDSRVRMRATELVSATTRSSIHPRPQSPLAAANNWHRGLIKFATQIRRRREV